MQAVPEIDLALCDRCGHCVAICPAQTLRMTAHGPEISDRTRCTFCALCEDICPQGAIRCAYEIGWAQVNPSSAPSSSSP